MRPFAEKEASGDGADSATRIADRTMNSLGGRRSTLSEGCSQILRSIREACGANAALLAAVDGKSGSATVLGCDGAPFVQSEPVTLRPMSRSVVVGGMRVESAMRQIACELSDVVVVPIDVHPADGHSSVGEVKPSVYLLLDVQPVLRPLRVPEDTLVELRRWRRRVRELRHRDCDQAYRLVAEAAAFTSDQGMVADVLLAAARALVASDAAYLAIPVDDSKFAFSRTLGIHTEDFRALRVGPGQGLGSVPMFERTPARSLNYSADPRFSPELLDTTGREGIYSAMAVPVMDDGGVSAVLYAANHEPLAYGSDDEEVLTEFATSVRLTLGSALIHDEQRQRARADERAAIARGLHDRLGRRLAEMAHLVADLDAAPLDDLRRRLDGLSDAIGECERSLRTELSDLFAAKSERTSAAAIVAAICEVPSLSGLRRAPQVVCAHTGQQYEACIPAHISDALVQIGQEAVFNAELHSVATTCSITLEITETHWALIVSDDGGGLRQASADREHLGLRMANEVAEQVGGQLRVSDSAGGVRVSCVIAR